MSETVSMILRQTNYTEKEAQEKLVLHNNDAIKVIEEYMGIVPKKETAITSVNQEKYKQFRALMDAGSENYRKNQALQK
jgi:hypothetical protein